MEDVVTALTTGFTSGAADTLGAIADIVPAALPVGLAIVVIRVGWRLYKMLTGR